MKKPEPIRTVSNALLALVSSVLTDLVYSEISSIRYEVQHVDGKIVLKQISQFGFWMQLAIIGGIFFAICAILFTIRRVLPQVITRKAYRNKKNYTKEQVYSIYMSAKSLLLETESTIQKAPDEIILYSKEIGGTITLMHRTFCPQKKRLNRVVKASFRTGMVCDFAQRISPYEYLAVINLIEQLLKMLKDSSPDEILQSDCDQLYSQLDELKDVLK